MIMSFGAPALRQQSRAAEKDISDKNWSQNFAKTSKALLDLAALSAARNHNIKISGICAYKMSSLN